jgi:hypothetical protein
MGIKAIPTLEGLNSTTVVVGWHTGHSLFLSAGLASGANNLWYSIPTGFSDFYHFCKEVEAWD